MINRRGLLTGLVGVLAAPAIVRASIIMPIKAGVLTRFTGSSEITISRMNEMVDALKETGVRPFPDGCYHMVISNDWYTAIMAEA